MKKDRFQRSRNPGERIGPIPHQRDLHRRADPLAQRAADLNKLADAWQPLYQTLSPGTKAADGLSRDTDNS